MAIERARKQLLAKPWGVADLSPWAEVDDQASPIGEIRYDRPEGSTATPALLLKLLFTEQPLSVQVHPNDVYARSIGQPNGKTESWYVLKADHRARVALGLDCTMSPQQLRQCIDDGSITHRIVWGAVTAGDKRVDWLRRDELCWGLQRYDCQVCAIQHTAHRSQACL